ncbi:MULTISPECIES: YwqJ-related putative deaminase [unclassified Streptomyces]|uniref:YwqJ-related putative deaminase n=1 Tax=unclassified Streptomyces TaxID=2593676 RepID=UPI00338ED7EC
MLVDGVGAFKAVKAFRAARAAAEAAEGSAAPLKKLLDDDVPTPSTKETPHENAPGAAAPSGPGAGTSKAPAGEGGASGADSSDGSGVLEAARELADKTSLDKKNFTSRSRPKVAESLELANGRVYSATSSGEQRPLHPFVQEVLDSVPAGDRAPGTHGKCGLPVCVSQALNACQNPMGGTGCCGQDLQKRDT